MCFMLRPYMIELRLPTYHHKRFFIAVVLFIVLAGLVKWCTTVALAADAQVSIGERVVTIHDGGEQTGLVTSAMTLREVLQQANVSINQNDITEPALDEPLVASSYEANIYRARPVVVKDGAKSVRIVTAYRTAKQIAKQAGIILNDADIAQLRPAMDIAVEGAAEVLSIDRATPITFVFYGKTIQTSTRATTVDGLLEERKIATSKDDTTQPGLAAPIVAGMTVELWRNGKQVVTVDEDIAFTTRQVKDVNRERTYKEIQTPGENGKRTVTYEIEMRDGKEVARTETNATTTKQPVEQVEVVGVKGMYTTPSENQSISWEFLISKGLTREQTAGIMGNLMQEHGFKTDGDGLAQWTGSRQTRLRTMYPDTYMTIQSQLDYLWYELSGPYVKVLTTIQAQTTVEGAVKVFQDQYERCNPTYCAENRRVQYANNILASH